MSAGRWGGQVEEVEVRQVEGLVRLSWAEAGEFAAGARRRAPVKDRWRAAQIGYRIQVAPLLLFGVVVIALAYRPWLDGKIPAWASAWGAFWALVGARYVGKRLLKGVTWLDHWGLRVWLWMGGRAPGVRGLVEDWRWRVTRRSREVEVELVERVGTMWLMWAVREPLVAEEVVEARPAVARPEGAEDGEIPLARGLVTVEVAREPRGGEALLVIQSVTKARLCVALPREVAPRRELPPCECQPVVMPEAALKELLGALHRHVSAHGGAWPEGLAVGDA